MGPGKRARETKLGNPAGERSGDGRKKKKTPYWGGKNLLSGTKKGTTLTVWRGKGGGGFGGGFLGVKRTEPRKGIPPPFSPKRGKNP